jgi:dienelactone hydrolase
VRTLGNLIRSGLLAVAASTLATEGPTPSTLKLLPLLMDAGRNEIKSREAWLMQRELIRKRWLNLIGEFPVRRTALAAEVLGTEKLPGFTRQHVKYQIESGVFTEAYLLSPTNTRGKLPAVVVFHPTTALHARGVAGLEAGYEVEKQQGLQLVRRGYVVLCPRNFIFDQGTNFAAFKAATDRMQARHPKWTGMARMTFDAFRALDFLESLPDVDAHRIGCLGHSLGAKVALYAGAFDVRYRAVVFSEGGIGLAMSNWDAPWYLGSQLPNRSDGMDHHELLALIAPRPLLLVAGDSADNDQSRKYVEAVEGTFDLLGASQNLQWFDHHLGHRYPPEARRTAEEFLDLHLKP